MVVLGARLLPNGQASPLLERRLRCALEHARIHRAAPVILTGAATAGPPHPSEAQVMAAWLTAAGLDPRRLVLEEKAWNTLDNARHALPLARACGATEVRVVTDRLHGPRAGLFFRLLGEPDMAVRLVLCAGPTRLDRLAAHGLREGAAWIRNAPRLTRAWIAARCRRRPIPPASPPASPPAPSPAAGTGDRP